MSISAVAMPEITLTLADPVIRVIAIVLLTVPRSRASAELRAKNRIFQCPTQIAIAGAPGFRRRLSRIGVELLHLGNDFDRAFVSHYSI